MNATLKVGIQSILALLMLAGTYFLGNLVPRTDFQSTLGLFILLFGLMLLIFALAEEKTPWLFIFLAGLLIRFSLFLAIPQWSDDYARFIWDGELVRLQENPYLQTPAQFMEVHPAEVTVILDQVFPLLNSPQYYSVYPPLNQGIFWLAAKASGGQIANGIIALRLILFLAEIAVFMLFIRVLDTLQLPQKLVILYWLNPLVIMEITGNLHFEGLVLLFLLAVVLAMQKGKMGMSGIFWSLAIGMKLLPLLLAPAFLAFGKVRKSVTFWVATGLVLLLCFGPLILGHSWGNFFQSLRLYQGKFEFNASVYYLLREVGFWGVGYNPIATITPILSLLTMALVIYFSWKKRPATLPEIMDLWVLIYLTYLILQPVVHPWYLIPALGLSLLTGRSTFLIWSFAAIFSYQAYVGIPMKEDPAFLMLEYVLVLGGICLDYVFPKIKSTKL